MDAPQDNTVVPLSGKPVFPRLCANCCAPATERLTIARIFHSADSRQPVYFQPYFCPQCIAAHRAEIKPDPTLFFRRLLHGWTLWIPMAGSFWVCFIALPYALEALAARDPKGIVLSGGIATLFALITMTCAAGIWYGSNHLAVKPPTSITSAVDFTSDQSQTFEPTWRRFTLRNQVYAQHFRDANRERLWSRSRPEAGRAMVLRHYGKYVMYALIAVFAVYAIADEFGVSLWEVLRNLDK
ncbi:MAG: hypothetical protein U0R19_31195 [Bryobacteraceae bacterium]